MVARLCTPIEGTDAARLADCLGLDPSRFAGANAGGGGGGDDAREDALVSGAAFFDDPARFKAGASMLPALSLIGGWQQPNALLRLCQRLQAACICLHADVTNKADAE